MHVFRYTCIYVYVMTKKKRFHEFEREQEVGRVHKMVLREKGKWEIMYNIEIDKKN